MQILPTPVPQMCVVRTRHKLENQAVWGLSQAPVAHQVAKLTNAKAHHAYPKKGGSVSSGKHQLY